MCRLAAYFGPPILVSEFILKPSRSIIKQSYDARERINDSTLPLHLQWGNLNGDGFGIGWYNVGACSARVIDTTPCTFTSVTPAWNNDNLNRLASKLESGLIFAHVRAAYPGMPVSEQNCHPFAHGNYMFMHNGVIAGFLDIRRRLLGELSDEAYNSVQSFHSDSAVSFALFLHHLPSMSERQTPEAILRALQATIATISRVQSESGITDTSLLNYVVSDGHTTVATRYVSNDRDQPASLYFAEGSAYEREQPDAPVTAADGTAAAAVNGTTATARAASAVVRAAGQDMRARSASVTEEADYHLTYSGVEARVCLIASEPVTASASDWVEVPRNTALIVCRERDGLLTVLQAPLCSSGEHPRQKEVQRCLEAVAGATAGISGVRSALRLAATACPTRFNPYGGDDDDKLPETPTMDSNTPSMRGALAKGGSTPALARAGSGAMPASPSKTVPAPEHLLTGHSGPVMALCVHGELLFSGSTDTTVKVWCLKQCKYLSTLRGHRDPIRCLSACGAFLMSAGAKTVRLWNLIDFSCVAVLRASDVRGSLKAVAVAPDGGVYVGGQDCQVKLFTADMVCGVHADSPRCMLASERIKDTGVATEPASVTDPAHAHCGAVSCLALCGEYLCSGSDDASIRVWRAGSLKFVKVLRGHRGSVLALHALPGMLLSGGRDRLIRVWDADTLVCRKTLGGHTDDILYISSVESPLATQSHPPPLGVDQCCGTTAIVLPLLSPTPAPDPSMYLEQNMPCATSHRPLLFATASADGTVKVWNAKDLSCLRTLTTRLPGSPRKAKPPAVMACALSPGSTAAALLNGNIAIFPTDELFSAAAQEEERVSADEEGTPAAKRARLGGADAAANGGAAAVAAAAAAAASSSQQKLEREFERALQVFIRIKTVSADPVMHEECFRGAKFLLRLLEGMGAEVKLVQPVEGKNPVVLGRLGADPSRPTVTCYGHYDVQPAMEPDWMTDPFEISAVDGYFIARGVSDNKGPILAFIYACKELLEEGGGGGLPCNVVFLIEGEEENGSIGFRDAVQQNLRWFDGTKAILISNTLWVGENAPCITYGMRGMITFSVEVRGPSKDLHSGNEGGVLAEPLVDLNKVLASLVDSRSYVTVPGFYDSVRPNMLTAALQRMQDCGEFSLEGYRRALGVQELTAGRSERELLTARWCQPALSVVDVRVGTAEDADTAHYRFGPTRFSVIPRAAVGKVSVRFVPDQDSQTLIGRLTTHIHHEFAKMRSGNSISVKVHSVGDWWEAPTEGELMRIAEGAVAAEWGETPLLVREGGTMPVASALEKMLGAPAVLLPMGQSSDCCHLANERIRRVNLFRGKNVIKKIFVAMGEAGMGAAAMADV